MSEVDRVKKEADRMHETGDHEAAYTMLLTHKESSDPELLWRLARATFKLHEFGAQKEKSLVEGLTYLDRAVGAGGAELGPVHKWYSILIGSKKDHASTKEKIQDAFLIKKHVEKAIELMPTDPTNLHVLGNWCFEVAGTPWYMRKAAQLIFSEVPSSSYEEALGHFLKAEEVRPNYYSRNFLMIGKCFLQLNKKNDAVCYLRQARDFSPKTTIEDTEVSNEARKLLEKLGTS